EMTREGATVQMTYVFEWVGEPNFFFMRPWGLLAIYFCDANGNHIPDEREERFFLEEDFVMMTPSDNGLSWMTVWLFKSPALRRPKDEGTVKFIPPKDARYVGFCFGSKLVTHPVPLPE